MEEEEEFDEVDCDHHKAKEEPCQDEKEVKKEDKRTGQRCCQQEREIPAVQPDDQSAAVSVVSSLPLPSVPPHCFSHQSGDSVISDVEIIAEVRVEDGFMAAVLPFVAPGFLRRGKSVFFPDDPAARISPPFSASSKRLAGGMTAVCRHPGSLTFCPRDVDVASALKGSTAAVATPARSPLPSPPCTSPSSPSSAPSSPSSSPSSSSSSHGGTVVGYHDSNRGHAEGGAVSSATGEAVSSTSVSLAMPSHTTPPSSNSSGHRSSSPCPAQRRTSVEIYDPFHPTEGEREGRVVAEDEEEGDEEDGDKYDPFDPTGSPGSDRGRDRAVEPEANSVTRKVVLLAEKQVKCPGSENEGNRPPVDSTELPVSTRSKVQPPRGREHGRDRGKGVRERKDSESDNSEIEEGEIVGAGDRERDRKMDRAGERSCTPDSPFLHSCPKPERILRVLDGEDFVSVRAGGDWALGRERDCVEDLRRKLVSRRKERYRARPSSSLSPPPPLPLAPPVTATVEKERRRKQARSSRERERQKQKQERGAEKVDKKKGKEKERNSKWEAESEGHRGQEEKRRENTRERSSRSNSSKRKRRLESPKHSSHQQSSSHRLSSSHRQRHRRHSSSSHSEERRRDWDRDRGWDRRDDREREKERETSRKSKRKREKGERGEESGSREKGGGNRKKAKGSREQRDHDRERDRDRDRDRDHNRDRRHRDRPVVPPSIQDLNGSDLFAIKRTITVTTTTTTTVPGSPSLPQVTPPQASEKSRKKKKKKRKRRGKEDDDDDDEDDDEEEEEEEEEPMSQSRDSSVTPLRYHGFDSDQFSEKLGVEVMSLDGEALDSDYPSLEDTPPHLPHLPHLPPASPQPSPKPKAKSKTGKHVKKKSRTGKKSSLAESSLKQKQGKCPPSVSPPSAPAASTPAKRARKGVKERDKAVKKEAGRSGKPKKLSRASRKAKLQSKVSVLVRDGVSSTTSASGAGKRGDAVGSMKDMPAPPGSGGAGVVGGSIAVVFCRDNESRSPFLKPCSEPVSMSGRSKDFGPKARKCGGLSTLAPPSSSSSSSSSSSHLSVVKSKKAEPSSTTSASSSSASSPSSSSTTKQKRKHGKRDREHRDKGAAVAEVGGPEKRTAWSVPLLDTQSGLVAGAKPSSPLPRQQALPPCSSSSSSSASVPPASSSPPRSPPVPLLALRDTRESTPDSQTVDSSCKTPDAPFVSDDGPAPGPLPSLAPVSNSPLSPLSLQAPLAGATSVSQSVVELKLPPEDQKAHVSPPCSSSSSSANSSAASLALSLPASSADPSSSASSSVSSSSATKLPPPLPPGAPPLPWSLQTGVDCTAGGVLALTALLFKMEEANLATRAKAQEFIQATSQILSQANQGPSQHLPPSSSSSSSSSSQVAPLPSLAPPPVPPPGQFILHSSLPLVSCTKTPPPHLHTGLSLGLGCAQTPPLHGGSTGATGVSGDGSWDGESKDPDKYLKKLHTQERAVEEVKLAIKPYYQRKDITKDEYKDILRKAVHKICHSRTGEINPVKVSNLVKLYVQRYKYFRKHGRKMDEAARDGDREPSALHSSS